MTFCFYILKILFKKIIFLFEFFFIFPYNFNVLILKVFFILIYNFLKYFNKP